MSIFCIFTGDENTFTVEKVLKEKNVGGVAYYYIKWKGYNEVTWEPERNILDKTLIRKFKRKLKSK